MSKKQNSTESNVTEVYDKTDLHNHILTRPDSYIGSISAKQSGSSDVSLQLALERESQNSTSMRFRFLN